MTGEDHRLSGFRSGTSDSATTSRLHSHIRKDTEVSATHSYHVRHVLSLFSLEEASYWVVSIQFY
jgi:hypothetical protein